jgi:hypothetical protein
MPSSQKYSPRFVPGWPGTSRRGGAAAAAVAELCLELMQAKKELAAAGN